MILGRLQVTQHLSRLIQQGGSCDGMGWDDLKTNKKYRGKSNPVSVENESIWS